MWQQDTWLGIFLYENSEMTTYEIAKFLEKASGREWAKELSHHILQSRLWENK